MRPIPILLALLVAAALYVLVFQRDAVFGGDSGEAVAADAPAAVSEGERRVHVVVQRSEARPVEDVVIVRGQTEAARQVEVRAETTGLVVSEPLRKGARVGEGDPLCVLDAGTRQTQLDEAEAQLEEARARIPEAQARVSEGQARLAEAEIEGNAARSLSEGGFASDTRVASSQAGVEAARATIQSAEAQLQAAQAGVRSAEASVAAARDELDKLEIRAPFGGLLESDTAELGALLQPGGVCATVIQLDPMKLVGFVPETEVASVEVGAMAGARLATGREVRGEVTFLGRSADEVTRTFRVEITVANDDLAIRDGQTAEIVIRGPGSEAHLLPQSALTLDDDGRLGYRVVEDGRAAFVPVEVLRDTRDGVYVAGLPPAAEVIVTGQEYVAEGVPVDVTYREPGAADGEAEL
jgi:multidrug efflux system membrane fusion protein